MILIWDPVENCEIRGPQRPGVDRMPERGTETAPESLNRRELGEYLDSSYRGEAEA